MYSVNLDPRHIIYFCPIIPGFEALLINTSMRFYEFATIKPIKPLTLAKARIAAGKKRVEVAKTALKQETEAQRQQRAREAQAKKSRQG